MITPTPLELIHVEDRPYVLATSSLADNRRRVLKHDDLFAVFDRNGDLLPLGLGEFGLYRGDTRHLSKLVLRLNGRRPLLLSSTVAEDNALLTVDLTNPETTGPDGIAIAQDTVYVRRAKFLWRDCCYEELTLVNYGQAPAEVRIRIEFEFDFCDIFEIRGTPRLKRGTRYYPAVSPGQVLQEYEGLDGRIRSTLLRFEPSPLATEADHAEFLFHLERDATETVRLKALCGVRQAMPAQAMPAQAIPPMVTFDLAAQQAANQLSHLRDKISHIETSNEQVNDWLNRSCADLCLMMTETPHGLYPYAGVPWFSTPFGRDALITALETLWVSPDLSRGVLAFLADAQATEEDPVRDAEPGKILHERRLGEMANLGEVPFGCYYGSVDATPLFVILAGAYEHVTGDLEFTRRIWGSVLRALEWIDTWGDLDQDGFVEYARKNERGILNQGWKDSHDSVMHADGSFPETPIAICEVQAYVYEARRQAARLARRLGDADRAQKLEDQAEQLRLQFEAAFWCEELATYALALDGDKRPCRVKSSNAGHCLFGGIVSPSRARIVADTLLGPDMFSGWGIRTLASTEARYNPMSYHNGSIWPHDNAVIAAGFARYGLNEQAARVMTGMLDTSLFVELHRLPELFCGFTRRPRVGPTLYPVACAPQAWAAGAFYLLLQSCLGLTIDAANNTVDFHHPVLPDWMDEAVIRNLTVGPNSLDFKVHRYPDAVGINVLRRSGDVQVRVTQ